MGISNLTIKVLECKGGCPLGHKAGDTFEIRGGVSPSGLCMTALSALVPGISVLMLGGSFPWEKDPEATVRACQDYKNAVIFEIRRTD